MTEIPVAPPNSIFVQIASYRDPQLVPTLLDLIDKAGRPDLLRIIVCWQHAHDETMIQFWQRGFGDWRVEQTDNWIVHHLSHREAKIELIDVPHMMTQGACWARNLVQQRYSGETVNASGLSRYRKNDWLDFHVSFESELGRVPASYVVELFDDAGNVLSRVRRVIDA
ncbi:GlcNAc-transferase family protein [Paraburkholderia youngii]|uniref:GlcNAc-transferase family protein n=1 Tax=Paraburkholderia youngii TaxID=2782701 RepID=UPI0035A029FC